MNRKELYSIFKASFRDWIEDNAVLRSDALTFFIILPYQLFCLSLELFLLQGYFQGCQLRLVQMSRFFERLDEAPSD